MMAPRRDPRSTAPRLEVVPPAGLADAPVPPADLGEAARVLWQRIVTEYEFSDPASVEILRQAVLAVDLAEQCRRDVQRDGLTIVTKTGIREHPAAKVELTARSLACRTLARLGLDLEPIGQIGRPPGAKGG